jgi:hypothetical protein
MRRSWTVAASATLGLAGVLATGVLVTVALTGRSAFPGSVAGAAGC